MKLNSKLLISFLVFITLFWFVYWFACNKYDRILENNIIDNQVVLASRLIEAVDRHIYNRMIVFREYSKDLILQNTLIQSNREFEQRGNIEDYIDAVDKEWTSAAEKELTPFISKLMSNELSEELREKIDFINKGYGHDVFSEVFVTNRFGANVSLTEKTTDYRQNDEAWWQAAKKNGYIIEDIAFDQSADVYAINAGIRVDDKEGNFLGVIKVVLNFEDISVFLKETANSRNNSVANDMRGLKLLTRDGKLIYSTKPFNMLEDLRDAYGGILSEHGEAEQKEYAFIKQGQSDADVEELIVHVHSDGYLNFSGLGWHLIIENDAEKVFAPVYKLRIFLFLVALFVTFLASLAYLLISRSIVIPLNRLKEAVTEIAKRNFATPIEVTSHDEIGELAASFRAMKEELQKTMVSRDLLQREVEQRKKIENNLHEAQSIAHLGSWQWNIEEDRIYWSDELYRLFGTEPQSFRPTYEAFLEHVHPDDQELVRKSVQNALNGDSYELDMRIVRKDGSERIHHVIGSVDFDNNNRPMWMSGTSQDITELKEAEKQIFNMACYDPVTDLPNRKLFFDRLTQALARTERSGNHVIVFFVDLDDFKLVNDTFGHSTGDLLLKSIGERLKKNLRKYSTISRIGGDEFTIIIEDVADQTVIGKVVKRISHIFSRPFIINGHDVFISASMGIAVSPIDGNDPDTLLQKADIAMYSAKKSGKNNCVFFAPEMNHFFNKRLKIESEIRHAIKNREFILYYQPQIELSTGRIVEQEALIRWEHPQNGILSPALFLPVAEESSLIMEIDKLVIDAAGRQLRDWENSGYDPVKTTVNCSVSFLRHGNILEAIQEIINKRNIDPRLLGIEITENILMENQEDTLSLLQQLKAIGIQIVIDDFGIGYSSLAYIKNFPVDKIKIDRSFINNVTTDPKDAAITKTIISLAHNLGLKVLAEGVETQEQLDFLHHEGCDEIQGYFISKPLPADEVVKFLKKRALFA